VTLKDIRLVGILGGSAGLDGAIDAFADGSIDPRPLISTTVGLDAVAAAFADLADGRPPTGAGIGAKVQVDPRA